MVIPEDSPKGTEEDEDQRPGMGTGGAHDGEAESVPLANHIECNLKWDGKDASRWPKTCDLIF